MAGVELDSWTQALPGSEFVSTLIGISDYEPGSFFKRELPCIQRLLEEHAMVPNIIVIDGYVFLDGQALPGLGKYLYGALGAQIPVIGVAKRHFGEISEEYEIFRGTSRNPLFVTSVGVSVDEAKKFIKMMHGPHRIPILLKRADQKCRGFDL